MIRTALYTVLALLLLTACARNEVARPTNQLDAAAKAMQQAAQANAYEFASFDMAIADRKLERARELARSDEDDDRREARRLAEQVVADAQLAEAKARLEEARSINTEMSQTVEALRDKTGEGTGGAP
jgi:hypothetical protein